MKKFLIASFATLSITAAGVGASANINSADAAETTQQSTDAVYQEFIEAGGTPELWEKVVLPESGGDPNAVNELGYKGLGQTKEDWGTGSVETQTKGMIKYAEDRYGSIDAAIDFRLANGWW